MSDFETIRYEQPHARVARIVLDRPESRNAQSKRMTYELNAAFDRAAGDDEVRVIILAGDGPHFSSGHDLRDTSMGEHFPTVGTWSGTGLPGAEGYMAHEEEIYLGMCWRWRNIPKPTIAATQGKAIAGALMLLWICDLIVASDDALFADPTLAMGVNGVEYFAHPWELGPRRAKEFLFTGDWLTARDAYELGMINRIVPREELEAHTLELAMRIAEKPSFALKLAKESVNQTLDAQGQWTAFRAAFSIHQLSHGHNRELFNLPIDPGGFNVRPADSTEKRPWA
ncbi:MAG: enoyl-CoA hydratase [Acidimicrobiales bacterium]